MESRVVNWIELVDVLGFAFFFYVEFVLVVGHFEEQAGEGLHLRLVDHSLITVITCFSFTT